jgi:N-acetylglucosaminyldiphosphoundecaprenol N-acetyl-beta-D-mannosaminyltransferase
MRKINKNSSMFRKTGSILNVNVDSSQRDSLLDSVIYFLKNKKQFFIVTPNPEIIVEAHRDQILRDALNSADISLPDGTGILFAAKVLELDIKRRIPGRLFMIDLFELSNKKKLKVYLLGGTEAVITSSLLHLKQEYPHMRAIGSVGPKLGHGGKPTADSEKQREKTLIQNINQFKPDILFIGLGAPKQEKWFVRNRSLLSVGGAMVVGGSLDVFSGYKKTPPLLFSRIGLEWLWRLLIEPSRLLRIVNAVVLFPVLIILDKIRNSLR